ncbi:hypothetical protein NEMBOFW57_009717 [Staphylotrichum longicolle]|uniref:Uncharacterized protein n=1 Tax=Staphylotrichum longicolle TaxID=669026 RepID=A0AAD4ETA9_9PEZI|nr:hypothetical protein NEMBOFW57_009717 [Staphylotrichum longicolle]
MSTPAKHKPESKWNNQAHAALLGVFVDIVATANRVSIVAHKEQIMASLEAHGFQFTWEAVRQRELLLLESPPIFLQTTAVSKTTLPQPTTHMQIFCLILLFTPLDLVVVKMPKWEEIRDDVFEAIIQVLPPISKEQQAEILAMLQAKGHVVTWNAVRQHLQKLRRKEDKNGGAGKADNGEGASGAVPPKTPGGRKKTATRTPGSAGSKRKNVGAEDDDEEDVKPVKMKKLKEETGVKSEESDTNDIGDT